MPSLTYNLHSTSLNVKSQNHSKSNISIPMHWLELTTYTVIIVALCSSFVASTIECIRSVLHLGHVLAENLQDDLDGLSLVLGPCMVKCLLIWYSNRANKTMPQLHCHFVGVASNLMYSTIHCVCESFCTCAPRCMLLIVP